MSLTRRSGAIALIALMALGSIAMWLGVPLGWLWIASRIADSSRPSMGVYLLVLVGIPVTMVLVGRTLSALNRAHTRVTGTGARPHARVQASWQRSMRGERTSTRPRTVLDVVMVASVALALLAFAVWFFAFAGSSLPT